jgi:4-amino-4-deoxy-L-arabinose transferase-like glycosyltransferase
VLIVGTVLLARRKRVAPADVLLLCFTLPPIAIVAVEAFVSRAHANWSGASCLPGAIVVAAWLVRWRARRLLIAALAIQAAIAAAFLAVVLSPRIADSLGASNSLKRARGWAQTAETVVRRARVESPAGLSAIAVNNRFLYDALAYYGRDYFREPLAPPLKIWIRGAGAGNQAEASDPLTPAQGQRVLVVAIESWFDTEMARDFNPTLGQEIDSIWLDRQHKRRLEMFVGEGFQPKPRDPVTGYPSPEWKPPDASAPLPTQP